VALLEVGEQVERPGRAGKTRAPVVGEFAVVRIGVRVDGQADLLEVVLALGAAGGLADLLDGGEQEADEDGDDGDHHQQLDQRERAARPQARMRHGTSWKRGEHMRRSRPLSYPPEGSAGARSRNAGEAPGAREQKSGAIRPARWTVVAPTAGKKKES